MSKSVFFSNFITIRGYDINPVHILGIIVTLYHIQWGISNILFTGNLHYNAHLFLVFSYVLVSTFSIESDNKLIRYSWYAWTAILLLFAVISTSYIHLNFDEIVLRYGRWGDYDIFVGGALILLAFETCRRTYGWPLPILGALVTLYALYGDLIPGALAATTYGIERIIFENTIGLNGLYGFLVRLSATFIALFMIFGGIFKELGGADAFAEVAKGIAGRLRSGPAQVAVISSGIVGSLTGAGAANVGATGSYSIPLMLDLGYDREYAGAIEAVASTGGQLMPPVMGAAVFIMATFLQDWTYTEIIIAAFASAILFYLTLMVAVELRAQHKELSGLPSDEQNSIGTALRYSIYLIPVIIVLYILVTGGSIVRASLYGIYSLLAIFIYVSLKPQITNGTSLDKAAKDTVLLSRSFAEGGRMVAEVGAAIILIAYIVETLRMTGILQVLSLTLIDITGGSFVLLLLVTAILSIAFGFGVNSAAAYLIVALLTAPVLVEFGVAPLLAHMYVFYYAMLAAISPPVAPAALVAVGISKGDFIKTGLVSMRLGIAAYLLPVIWIIYPEILLLNQPTVVSFTFTFLKVLIAMIIITSVFEGYLFKEYTALERVGATVSVILILWPDVLVNALGFVLFAFVARTKFVSLAEQIKRNAKRSN